MDSLKGSIKPEIEICHLHTDVSILTFGIRQWLLFLGKHEFQITKFHILTFISLFVLAYIQVTRSMSLGLGVSILTNS